MFMRASTRPSGRGGLRLRQVMMLILPLFLFLLFLVFFSSRPDDIKEPKVGNAFSLTNKKGDEQQAAKKRQIGNVLNRLGEAVYVKNSDLPDLISIPDDENVEDEEIDAGNKDLTEEEKGDDWNRQQEEEEEEEEEEVGDEDAQIIRDEEKRREREREHERVLAERRRQEREEPEERYYQLEDEKEVLEGYDEEDEEEDQRRTEDEEEEEVEEPEEEEEEKLADEWDEDEPTDEEAEPNEFQENEEDEKNEEEDEAPENEEEREQQEEEEVEEEEEEEEDYKEEEGLDQLFGLRNEDSSDSESKQNIDNDLAEIFKFKKKVEGETQIEEGEELEEEEEEEKKVDEEEEEKQEETDDVYRQKEEEDKSKGKGAAGTDSEKDNEFKNPLGGVKPSGSVPVVGKGWLDLLSDKEVDKLQKWGNIDLHGLQCEVHPTNNTRIQCFEEDEGGRDNCPDYVNPYWLTSGASQWSCVPEERNKYYCTAKCQEGNEVVQWTGNEIDWCRKNPGSCDDETPLIPFDDFEIKPWSLPPEVPFDCKIPKDYSPLKDNVTVVMLAHKEIPTLNATLTTYANKGMLQATGEFLLYLNGRTSEMEEALYNWTRPPYSIRIVGTSENVGILRAINALMDMASRDYILFLEKDFQLVEPVECVEDQLDSGLKLLQGKGIGKPAKDGDLPTLPERAEEGERGEAEGAGGAGGAGGAALGAKLGTGMAGVEAVRGGEAVRSRADPMVHVVKYRSRHRPGRPNWAAKMYKGKEDNVFNRQPNLLCNFYHWIDRPDLRFPDQFWKCYDGNESESGNTTVTKGTRPGIKTFYCAKSKYCNWTNNPFLLDRRWWKEAYRSKFDKFRSSDPYKDLESYMNWEPGAWNEMGWVVASGEGLFKHTDLNNFG